MRLYLDLETIPAQSPEIRAKIAETVTPPARMSKPETIAAWEANDKPAAIAEALNKTALDGTYGHVCCIGWALDDALPDSSYAQSMTAGHEATIIRDFLSAVNAEVSRSWGIAPTVIGHNVINFDIRFLWQRAIVLGVQMPSWFPRDPKPWGDDVFDTMLAWAGARGMIGMDRLCEALRIPGKDGFDGSMVADAWARGEYDKIAAYCRDDIERIRGIHKRMMIAFGEADAQQVAA